MPTAVEERTRLTPEAPLTAASMGNVTWLSNLHRRHAVRFCDDSDGRGGQVWKDVHRHAPGDVDADGRQHQRHGEDGCPVVSDQRMTPSITVGPPQCACP